MKKLLILSLFSFLLFFGCNRESDVTSPEQSIQTQEPNWMALPQTAGMQVNNIYTSSKIIDGKAGGYLQMDESYSGGPFGTVSINANITFARKSFLGQVNISMTNDDASCVATFGPSMEFIVPAIFNITYSGLDIQNSNLNGIKFVYIAADGTVQPAVHDGIVLDKQNGIIGVINARIPHFSRYGFVN